MCIIHLKFCAGQGPCQFTDQAPSTVSGIEETPAGYSCFLQMKSLILHINQMVN